MVRAGKFTSTAGQLALRFVWACLMCGMVLAGSMQTALAGNYTFTWGAAPYTWTTGSLGPNSYTLTDQYGFQLQVRFTITETNGTAVAGFPDDIPDFGTQQSIGVAWDPPVSGSLIGGSPVVGTLEVLNGGTAFGVSGLTFRVSDIDAVDNNQNPPTTDRCDHVTFTGNVGNPALTPVTGTPVYLLGPGAGAASSPALAANQAQCNFQTSTGVTTGVSTNDDNGSLTLTYPNGTHTATVTYNESIRNVFASTTADAATRGLGLWSSTSFSVNSSISLDKQTTSQYFANAGEVINYSYVVTNNGPLVISSSQNIQIQDSKIGTFNCPAIPPAGIVVGGTHICTASYTITAADVTAGSVSNTALAGVGTGTQSFASRLQSNSDVINLPRRAVLTLVKTVTNDNGGTATTAAFTLTASGPTTISGVSGNAAVTNANVLPGSYALSETNVTGYAAGTWSCTSGSLSGSTLTLSAGQTATCSINNNDVQPRLTLVKTVTNNNGGTATTANFTLTATGPTTITGVSGNAAVTNAGVNAGTYALSETNLAGYAAGAWSCTAGTLSGSSLTLAVGQTATCTINNNDIGPVLTLIKTITGDGAPSGIPSFTLTATGPVTISGVTGNAAVTNATVNAGTYALTEAGPAGYTAGAWSCTGGSLAGSNLTLALGQTASCTINNIKLPTLTLRKISNGGVGAFSFSGTNGVPNQTITTTTAGGTFTGSAATLTAASTSTSITEALPANFWQIQTTACTGMGTGGSATRSGNTLTLNAAATAAGRNIVCTFTNRRRPTVSVKKITTGGFGGAFSFADTNLTGTLANINTTAANTATPAVATRLIASTTGTAVTITETSPLSFVPAGATCSDANSVVSGNTNPVATTTSGALSIPGAAVRIGADINCVFTNALAVPQLAVSKSANVGSVSAAGSTVNYTISVNNTGNTTLTSISVTDALGAVVCPSTGSSSITTLAPGGSESCTFTYNTPQSAFDSNGGGDGDIDNTATANATYNASAVSANGSTSVALVVTPGLTIEKLADTAGPVNAGNSIGYSYRVTNTGNVTINNVTINDVHNGFGTVPSPGSEAMFNDAAPLGNSTDAAPNASWDSLAPGDTVVFSANYNVVQADIDNP